MQDRLSRILLLPKSVVQGRNVFCQRLGSGIERIELGALYGDLFQEYLVLGCRSSYAGSGLTDGDWGLLEWIPLQRTASLG